MRHSPDADLLCAAPAGEPESRFAESAVQLNTDGGVGGEQTKSFDGFVCTGRRPLFKIHRSDSTPRTVVHIYQATRPWLRHRAHLLRICVPGGRISDLPVGLFSEGARGVDAGGGRVLHRQYIHVAPGPAIGKSIVPVYPDALLYRRTVAGFVAAGEGCRFAEVAGAAATKLIRERETSHHSLLSQGLW